MLMVKSHVAATGVNLMLTVERSDEACSVKELSSAASLDPSWGG